jgi:3-oxoadipate enol-lactonase
VDFATVEAYDLAYGAGELKALSDGSELYYEVRGPVGAPTLVIVNNYFIICPLWRNFTAELASRYRVVTYDLRNQGASSRAGADLTFERHVDDLEQLLAGLGLDDVFLLGTSISTLICRDYALRNPGRVQGMILLGPVFNPFGDRRRKYLTKSWLHSLAAGGPRGLFDHIYPLVYSDRTIESGGSATYLALRERFLALNSPTQLEINLKASLTTDDDPRLLSNIGCPTLLAAGESDFLASPASIEATARLMPRGRSTIIPMAGHVPYFEATAAFEALVGTFVADVTEEADGKGSDAVVSAPVR